MNDNTESMQEWPIWDIDNLIAQSCSCNNNYHELEWDEKLFVYIGGGV